MMEKYGVEQSTYEVVKVASSDEKIIGSNLSLSEANELQKLNAESIIRAEK